MRAVTMGGVREQARAEAGRLVQAADQVATWVYQRQRADQEYAAALEGLEARAAGLTRYGRSGDGCFQVARLASLGVTVDQSGRGRGALDPDAEAIHEWVLGIDPSARLLIVRHGRRGDVPDWSPGRLSWCDPVWKDAPEWEWYEDGDGVQRRRPRAKTFKVVYTATNKASYCPVEPGAVSAYQVAAMRAEYALWHRALSAMAEHFGRRPGLLRRLTILPPRLPAAPWSELKP